MSRSSENFFFRLRFNAESRSEMYDAIASFTKDGLPLFNCLADMYEARAADNSFLAPMLKRVMGRIRGKEGGASSLGEALAGFVPEVEAVLITAGERGGDITKGLQRASHVAMAQSRLQGTVLGALTRPAGYIIMVFVMLLVVGHAVLPAMEKAISRDMWPPYARLLGTFADHAILIFIATSAMVAAWGVYFAVTAASSSGSLRKVLERWLFPFGIYGQINEAVLLLSLAAMVRVGLPMDVALDTIRRRSGGYIGGKIKPVQQSLQRGDAIGKALMAGIQDIETRWQVGMYAKTSYLSDGLEKLADRGIERLIKSTKRRMDFMGTLLLAVIAFFILWVMGSFLGVSMSMRQLGQM